MDGGRGHERGARGKGGYIDMHTYIQTTTYPCDAEAKAAAAICDLESGPGPLRRTPGNKMSRQGEKPKTLEFQGRGIESMS